MDLALGVVRFGVRTTGVRVAAGVVETVGGGTCGNVTADIDGWGTATEGSGSVGAVVGRDWTTGRLTAGVIDFVTSGVA
jgi:hypothetical protein